MTMSSENISNELWLKRHFLPIDKKKWNILLLVRWLSQKAKQVFQVVVVSERIAYPLGLVLSWLATNYGLPLQAMPLQIEEKSHSQPKIVWLCFCTLDLNKTILTYYLLLWRQNLDLFCYWSDSEREEKWWWTAAMVISVW